MPKHDIPDGNETKTNLIDLKAYLRRRIDPADQGTDGPESDTQDRDAYRHAEYGDGKRPRLSRYDLIWVTLILAIGWIVWAIATSRG